MRCLIVLALLAGLAGPAGAEIVHFLGPHPIAPTVMRGMCHVEGPHIHDYIPHKSVLYVQAGDGWAFVGDPTEYEAEVPRFAYYGHHPVFWAQAGQPESPHVCYITGPHHHWYAPPSEQRFVARGGAYWYVGAMPRGYQRRWHRHSPIDDYYGTVSLTVPRPVIAIAPPEGYVGFYVGPRARPARYRRGYYGPGVGVGVQVDLPAPPGLNIVIGGGGGPVFVGPGPGRYHGGPPGHGHGHRGRKHGKGRYK